MIAIHLPSFSSVGDAFEWLEGRGRVVRLVLYRGPDGLVRGSALIERQKT